MTSLLIMSFRGRILRRNPLSANVPMMSYDQQVNQYYYLANVLNIAQYNAQSWISAAQWLQDMVQTGGFVQVNKVYPKWAGPSTARAVKIPVRSMFVLDLIWENIGGTNIPTGQKAGFIYKLSSGAWIDDTLGWANSGAVPENALCHLTLTSSFARPMVAFSLGLSTSAELGSWLLTGQIPVECYYVFPFFDIPVNDNGDPSNVMLIQQK